MLHIPALKLVRRPSMLRAATPGLHPRHFVPRIVCKRYQSASTVFNPSIGVGAAIATSQHNQSPRPTLFNKEFALDDRVALVSGANGDIGLEMALAFIEAGARAVYCVDLPEKPSATWEKVREYARQLEGKAGEGRLEYISCDVTNQERMWNIGKVIGDKEGRMDVCVAAAGVVPSAMSCLDFPAADFQKVLDVNVNGVLFTAQAAGRQMERFGNGGSIILVSSAAGSIGIKDINIVPYGTSKSAVLQMARSMACELAPKKIRVNSLSPGWVYTKMTAEWIDSDPNYFDSSTPMGRVSKPHEFRGVAAWLASDASTYCTGSNILVDGGVVAW